MEVQSDGNQEGIFYFTLFQIFNPSDIQLFCHYKQFIEALIMQLGEDWRIESSLFTEEILAIKRALAPATDGLNFSLFNEYLSSFLKGRANKEYEICAVGQSQIQELFLQKVSESFSQEEIKESLTFKTLSLGFCITASEIWGKTFKGILNQSKQTVGSLKQFAKLSFSNVEDRGTEEGKTQWKKFSIRELKSGLFQTITKSFEMRPHKLSKAHVFGNLVCEVSEARGKDVTVRMLELCNQFYVGAFVVWLIFNIKMFFALTFADYLKFCKDYMQTAWQERFESPLMMFQKMLDKEWSRLLKDYTVALHDDFQVLKMLVQQIHKELQHEWQSHLMLINPSG